MFPEIKIKATNVFQRNLQSKKPVVINIGGARSSKSYSIMQLLLYRAVSIDNMRILICRKTFPSLRISTILPFFDIFNSLNISSGYQYSKKDNILFIRSSKIIFRSIDEMSKIKSTEFNYIFMEEANEFDYNTFQVLKMRLSGKNKLTNQIILAFNPVPCWIWDNIIYNISFKNEIDIIRSNYKDNPFLSDEYKQLLENLKNQNERLYKIYALGEYAEFSEDIIFQNWEVVDCIDWNKMDDIIYGLDFGYYPNPTALVKIGIRGNDIFAEEMLYKQKITNSDLIYILKGMQRYDIYADSAEPNRIEEIYRENFNIYPATKDVQFGIDILKRKKIYVSSNSENLLKEIKTYCYKKDKNEKILQEPVKYNDHLIDAMRYAVASRQHNNRKVQIWNL